MSRCCCNRPVQTPVVFPTGGYNNCICSLPTLVILILIVLQFSKHGKGFLGEERDEECCEHQQVGNGILFIIALFFLSCAGCGRGNY